MKLHSAAMLITLSSIISAATAQTASAPIGSRVDAQLKTFGEALQKDPTGNQCVDQATALIKLVDEERVNPEAAKVHPLSERVAALYKLVQLDSGLIIDPKTDEQKADLVKQVTFTLGPGKETPKPGTPDFDRLVKLGSDFQTSQRLAIFKAAMSGPADDFKNLAAKVSELLPDKTPITSRAALLKPMLELAKAGKLPK